ncbi:MAG: pilus assembly protein PilM [Methylacidiphilales bacterium]|nr:pilus assembly protein PilM [Candidatus Methylacidiphilales bacterium]
MLNSKSFLAVDFGAGTLKSAEFEINEAGGLRLKQYGLKSLGAEGSQETAREAAILKTLQELLAEKSIRSRNVNVCLPGFHVFSKFVKLPPVDAGKVTQIIQYEAQQNVPFPLEEVVWDYQILGSTAGGELEVLLVAIKADIVEGLFRVTETVKLHLQLADVSPAALCNAFRYNYGELEDCTMLLDIGAKTSNLLFFEKGKVYSRSINLGANSITQDFANESKKKFDVAEKIKIEEGFVSLGGAYEEPENQDQAAISKIARQFMTRLHIQVNQTMQFYRGQQSGSAPQRLFLSGGASIMPYTAQFFAEKINVPVEYFNPLRNVQIDPSINLEELARVAHSLGEVVGLGLRNLAHCPVELNLMPASTLKWQRFNQKKPYFIATVLSLVAVIAAMGFAFSQLADVKQKKLEEAKALVGPRQLRQNAFDKAYGDMQKTRKEVGQVVDWMGDRFYWADVLSEFRQVLMRVEESVKLKQRTDAGVWIENFTMETPGGGTASTGSTSSGPSSPQASSAAAQRYLERYGPRTAPTAPRPPTEEAATTAPKKPKGSPGEISTVAITFRALSLNALSADANKDTAFTVLTELRKSEMVDPDPNETKFASDVGNEEPPGTFTFSVTVKLKHPLAL